MAKKQKNYFRTFSKKNAKETGKDLAHRFVYVIKCKGGYWYIGQTKHPSYRYMQHESGEGSWFTKKYRPIKMTKIIHLGMVNQRQAELAENDMTEVYIQRHGVDRVRGGEYIQQDKMAYLYKLKTKIDLKPNPKRNKAKKLWSKEDIRKAEKELNLSTKVKFGKYTPIA